jgi:DUF4097 and DUF4098 domain-containing protein YvlB
MSEPKTKMIKRILIATLISVGVLLVVPHKRAMAQKPELVRDEFHQTYPLSQNGRVSLENIMGDVRISVWDRNEVKLDAVKSGYSRQLLADAEIKVISSPDSIRIHTQYPSNDLTFNSDGDESYKNPATVTYTLTIPRNARLSSIELVNGDLNIEGVAGDVTASSVNGEVSAINLAGEVKLGTVNGTLRATYERLDESKSVSLGSVNGDVVLIIPSDSNAIVKAGTVHGGIRNDFGLPVRAGEYVGRELYGQIGRGGMRVKLGNVNGSVEIKNASDGKPKSPANSLLSAGQGKAVGVGVGKGEGKGKGKGEAAGDDDDDYDYTWESDGSDEKKSAARQAARDAVRAQQEAARAQREATRATREAERAAAVAVREAARAKVEADREVTQATVEAQREAAAAGRAAAVEGARSAVEAQREIQRAQREIERAAREDARRNVWVYAEGSNYRLVERDSANFDVEGKPQLNVETFDGAVVIRGWDKPQVNVIVVKRASTEKGLKGARFSAKKTGNAITLTADFDPAFAQQIAPGVTSVNANVSLEIFVPRNITLRAISGDGRVTVEGVNGEFDLKSGDGAIDVVDGRGRILVRTGDGRIRIAKFIGAADVVTGDGRILLDGRFTQLAARTGEGTITLAVPADFNATLETDATKVINETGLMVVEESGASKRLRRWKIGKGGTIITLRAGEGRIILQRAEP